jgi:hypothetical protein
LLGDFSKFINGGEKHIGATLKSNPARLVNGQTGCPLGAKDLSTMPSGWQSIG